jgi:hypothetical protein
LYAAGGGAEAAQPQARSTASARTDADTLRRIETCVRASRRRAGRDPGAQSALPARAVDFKVRFRRQLESTTTPRRLREALIAYSSLDQEGQP